MNEQLTREALLQQLEATNSAYWDAQARLGSIMVARAVIMNQLQEMSDE